jgi:hypothetical protein
VSNCSKPSITASAITENRSPSISTGNWVRFYCELPAGSAEIPIIAMGSTYAIGGRLGFIVYM